LAISKKVNIVVAPTDSWPLAVAEPALLENILGNLLSNAIKYSPSGGKVTIQTITIQNKVQISISDEGPGMDVPMELSTLTPNLKDKASESGWGIGLKLTKQYVEMMGGRLVLQPDSGPGATFIVELMLAN
jgi:hypothetical protein